MYFRARNVNMSDIESIEVNYEIESVVWESEDEELSKSEEKEEKQQQKEPEKSPEAVQSDSPKKGELMLPRVKSLVIPARHVSQTNRYVGIRAPYRYQVELQARDRKMLLFEAYNERCCVWQPNKGRLLLYIPQTKEHERHQEWYVYPALRIFPGKVNLIFNLELTPKVQPVFDGRSLRIDHNLVHVKYRANRRKGIKLTKGLLFGYLYVHELWEPHHATIDMGESQYCNMCERVGHTAMRCPRK